MSKPGDYSPIPPLTGATQPGSEPEQAVTAAGHTPPESPESESPDPDMPVDTGNAPAVHPTLMASLEAAIRVRQAQENGEQNTATEEQGGTAETDSEEISGYAPALPAPPDSTDTDEGATSAFEAPGSGTEDPVDGDESEADEDDDDYDDSEYEDDEEDDEDEGEEDDDGEDDEEEGAMSLRDHLRELRKRVVRAFLFALLGFFCCYPFAEQIYGFLLVPLLEVMPPDSMLIYTSVPEAFFTYLKVAFFVGIFAASPLIFYQIWAFIAPGLYREEKMYIVPVAIMSAVCFTGGGAFCFFAVFPIAFEFFMSYNVGRIQAMPSLREYLSFVLQLIFAFGLVFEMPLFIFFLARLGIVTAAWLRKFRRYMILICFIVAAILTPPDVLSQLLMAGPMILLYEVSILLAAAFGKKAAPSDNGEEEEEEEDEDQEDVDAKNDEEEPDSGDGDAVDKKASA